MADHVCRRNCKSNTIIFIEPRDMKKTVAKHIMAIAVTGIYLTLSLAGPFAVFHRHQMPVQESPASHGHELHDTSCDKHVIAHVHLSDHCASCQFLTTKQSSSLHLWNLIGPAKTSVYIFNYHSLPSSQHHLSVCAGRAPPSFLS